MHVYIFNIQILDYDLILIMAQDINADEFQGSFLLTFVFRIFINGIYDVIISQLGLYDMLVKKLLTPVIMVFHVQSIISNCHLF